MKCKTCGREKEKILVSSFDDSRFVELCMKCSTSPQGFLIDTISESNKKRVFLSGPITGHEKTYKKDFAKYKKQLEKKGYMVISPIENDIAPKFDKKSWLEYIKNDLDKLVTCDAIYQMPGFEESAGCQIEMIVADKFGLEFINE